MTFFRRSFQNMTTSCLLEGHHLSGDPLSSVWEEPRASLGLLTWDVADFPARCSHTRLLAGASPPPYPQSGRPRLAAVTGAPTSLGPATLPCLPCVTSDAGWTPQLPQALQGMASTEPPGTTTPACASPGAGPGPSVPRGPWGAALGVSLSLKGPQGLGMWPGKAGLLPSKMHGP